MKVEQVASSAKSAKSQCTQPKSLGKKNNYLVMARSAIRPLIINAECLWLRSRISSRSGDSRKPASPCIVVQDHNSVMFVFL
jgi:hypothetical protein